MVLELQRAERVRDVLERIGRGMSEVVDRIDTPRVAGAMVMRAADAVEHRIAHVDVRGGHVDLRAQDVRTVLELSGPHPREHVQVLVRPYANETGSPCPAR